ncbi:MAG: hypothetical protein HF973_13335 [Chloroflexi bacterium]|nr:hypothetical protein [Chloroflexota bacterium]
MLVALTLMPVTAVTAPMLVTMLRSGPHQRFQAFHPVFQTEFFFLGLFSALNQLFQKPNFRS